MTRPVASLLALVVAMTVSACGQAGPTAAMARKAPGAARALAAADEPGLVRTLALQAHGALLDADAAYKALGLDTAAGRKLTPKREPAVREGLTALVHRLEAATADIATKLGAEDGSAKLATLRAAFVARAPRPDDVVPADADANALLYRVAQYRLKLASLVEYALRRGLLAELPAPAPKAPAPGSGGADPGEQGVEE
jgi:hypothetical protein